jgi:hypothetical protein
MKFNLFAPVAVCVLLLFASPASAEDPPAWKWYEVKDGKVQIHLHVFWSETCPHCVKAHTFIDGLKKRHDWLKVWNYEVSRTSANLDLYRTMAENIGKKAGQVPAFFYCKQLDIGFVSDETSGKRLEDGLIRFHEALQKQLEKRPTPKQPPPDQALLQVVRESLLLLVPPEGIEPTDEPDLDLDAVVKQVEQQDQKAVDLPWWGTVKADEVSLPALTVVLGGLDAFNPCAFFVLLILLGLMVHTRSKRKMLLIGVIFVFVSGLVYFMFMAAWLNLFFLVGHMRVITLAAGVVAVIAAVINIKDFFFFKQGVSLSMSDSARSRLVKRMTGLLHHDNMLSLIAGTAGLAFAANLYELLCTAGIPLVYTRVLTLRQLAPVEYYGYLALYNAIYVTPLFLIVVGFSFTFSAHKLTEYQGRVLKLISGLMMLALGVILVTNPALLNNLIGAGVTLVVAVGGAFVIALIHRAVTRPSRASVPRSTPDPSAT